MKKTLLTALTACLFGTAVMAQDNSARPGFIQDTTPPEAPRGGAEDFADITTLPGDGWILDNQSNPVGTSDWFQGNDTVFPAQAGAPTAYIGANFNNTAGSDICNWLIMPDNGFLQSVTFWTRTVAGSTFPDRLYVVHSPTGGTTTGDCFGGFGDFTNNLLMINDGLVTGGYPEDWTEFTVNPNATGRVAFVYYVANGGPVGANSNYIGVDTVSFVAGVPDADLTVAVTNNAVQPVQINDQFQFNVNVTNNGPAAATGVVATNTLSGNLTYVSSDCGATNVGNTVTWNVGGLANAASAMCNITVQVNNVGTLTNSVSVTGNENDPNGANNASSGNVAGPAQTIPSLSVIGMLLMALLLMVVAQRRIARD